MIKINGTDYSHVKDGLVAAKSSASPIVIHHKDNAYLYDRDAETLTDLSCSIRAYPNSEPNIIKGNDNIVDYFLSYYPLMVLENIHKTIEVWDTFLGYIVTYDDRDRIFKSFNRASNYALRLMQNP